MPNQLIERNGNTRLTTLERTKLTTLEGVIEHNLRGLWMLGVSLTTIRDEKLYRGTHKTFEAYGLERWKFSRPRLYQLLDYAEVIEDLSTRVDIASLPELNERQARELAPYEPAMRVRIFEEARDEAPDGNPTAALLRAKAKELSEQLTGRDLLDSLSDEAAKGQVEADEADLEDSANEDDREALLDKLCKDARSAERASRRWLDAGYAAEGLAFANAFEKAEKKLKEMGVAV